MQKNEKINKIEKMARICKATELGVLSEIIGKRIGLGFAGDLSFFEKHSVYEGVGEMVDFQGEACDFSIFILESSEGYILMTSFDREESFLSHFKISDIFDFFESKVEENALEEKYNFVMEKHLKDKKSLVESIIIEARDKFNQELEKKLEVMKKNLLSNINN